jgi:hypothetical protein
MKQDCLPIVKPTIEEIQKQFIAWRNNRRCREPVPDALLELAVSLAEDYSIGQICKVLGLNHRQLKRKIQAHSGNGYQEEGRSCHFVELEVSKPGSDAIIKPGSDAIIKPGSDAIIKPGSDAIIKPESDAISKPESDAISKPESDEVSKPESDEVSKAAFDTEYVMEMEDQKGGKLKVHIKGEGGSFNLLEMARAFWGRDK